MKKILSLVLVACMMLSVMLFTSCDSAANGDLKIGVILIGDENEGYSFAHIDGIQKAAKAVGLSDSQIIWKYKILEDEGCADAINDLIDQGCTYIFSNSYGHQSYMQQAATENPDINFIAMTGDTAAASELENFSNAFTSVYESRYVSGVVAGMKIAELVEQGKLTDANYTADGKVKIGYVGAYPYAEVVSGYTAFFLGIRSVYEDVAMEVTYTNSWFTLTGEATAAEAMAAKGCVIICQHADSTGAPSAVEALNAKGQVVYSVGYNVDMLEVAPNAALTSATNNWSAYYTKALEAATKGERIMTNWSAGYAEDAVGITKLGPNVAEGTQAKVDEVVAALKAGTLKVFDTSKFTVGGEKVADGTMANVIPDADYTPDTPAVSDGYFHESEYRSAPYFELRIDGITENS